MESIINLQNDLASRISKGKTNFKKSPKERISHEYVNGRLDVLEQLWSRFVSGHEELAKNYSPEVLKRSTYVTDEMYDKVEEIYLDYKCELQCHLVKFQAHKSETSHTMRPVSIAKLPKINIPTFSGNYSEWCSFKELFKSLIINNSSIDNIQKLHYLKGCLVGEAEQILRHIPIQEENFERCWELLTKRYDNKRFVSNHAIKRLLSQKNLLNESATGLKSIVDTTDDCLATLSNLGIDIKSWDILIIHILTLKLDPETRRQWEFNVASLSEELPTYGQFKNFLMTRYRALEFLNTKSTPAVSQSVKIKSLHVKNLKNVICPYCKNDHKLTFCKDFQKQCVDTRRKFVFDNNICFNCMGGNHSAKDCRSYVKCHICKRNHHSLLHPKGNASVITNNDNNKENKGCVATSSESPGGETKSTPLVSCFATETVQQQVLLATALVEAISRNGVGYKVRALLDQGSQSSFVTESTVQYLGLNKTPIRGKITGLGGDKPIISKAMVNIEMRSLINSNVRIQVKAYVLKSITSLLPTRKIEKLDWPEINNLVLADPQFYIPNHIDLLLGAETYSQILQEGIKKGPVGTLIAQATSLGWILSGMVNPSNDPVSQIQVMHCCTESNDMLKKFWELESDQLQPKETMFTDDEKRCEQYFYETTQRDEDGRYIVRLPFKKGTPEVTASREIAEKRLKSLENRLNKDEAMKAKYQEVIDEYLHLDHMELVPKDDIDNDRAIYLPHHAVVRSDKETTKVRIVYDASCKGKNNLSLNDQLLVGPTLQPELRCIVMQWRISPICMSADIVKMYRQVKVNQQDVDYQRILWRENDNQEIKSYRLTRVTFGTAAAPYLAVKALQQVAHDHGVNYPSASKRILKHFYVDDLMTGVNSVEEGKAVYNEISELLSKAGFELQKWCSNSNELLEAMKRKETEKDITESLKIKEDEITKIMGLTWDRSEDSFRYVVHLPELQQPVTKRRIISDISRLYDPLGWVGPSIIIAKIMIQKLWLAALDWDDKIPDNIINEWLTYREDQINFNKLRIPRWHGTNVNEICREIHGFCDASKVAYAAAVYLRVLDSAGKVTVTLVTAKTKVAPVKQISIPRLELCGAVLLSRLLLEVAQVMNVEKHNIHAWTDSTVVLAWLNNHPSKWNVFVANRVSEILNNLEPTTWCHVSSKQNPADGASRGLRPSELVNNDLWFHGPEFISREPIIYLRPKEVQTEMEAVKTHCATLEESMWDKYSSLTKTVRVMAYCRRFIINSRIKSGPKITTNYLTAKELRDTLTIWIKECQSNNFNNEIKLIKENKNLPKTSKLKTLNPFLDDDGVLRVGGRLSHSTMSINMKHPIIIPRQSHLTELIISDAHKQTLHGGPQLTLAYVLSKYWILGGKQLIKSYYRRCVICVKSSAVTKNPLMGQLPAARVTPTRPFSHSGVDYAGPIQIRTAKGRGHKSHKGYICLFICMATRAIHLEVVTDLTTEGFLQAFKRFVARRGNCSHLWSDNGTNFVGAATELQKRSTDEHRRLNQEIAEALAINNCEWHFIPPQSPNFGGLWEAGVKSVKYHLKRVIGNSTLTYEEMATVLAQIEACLNSRPMSVLNDQPDNFMVLTPGHFLIGESPVAAPDYNFEKSNVSSLRRWQHTQRMLQTFWRQWSQEYLTKFLRRHKWTDDHQSQPSLGDIVVIKEDHLPPCRWLYGRITATHPGEDNVVRVVSLKTKNGFLKRPLSKLCFLPTER